MICLYGLVSGCGHSMFNRWPLAFSFTLAIWLHCDIPLIKQRAVWSLHTGSAFPPITRQLTALNTVTHSHLPCAMRSLACLTLDSSTGSLFLGKGEKPLAAR